MIFPQLRLRRIITSNSFIPEIDGFRFLAILAVVIPHLYLQCGPLPTHTAFAKAFASVFAEGRRGVLLFFTISGFILALPFARHHLAAGKPVKLASYFKRRLTRLEPPYIVAMAIRCLIFVFRDGLSLGLLLHLSASLLYLHNFIYDTASTINPPAWSLEVEVQFYLLAPILARVFQIKSKSARRLTIILTMLIAGALSAHYIVQSGRWWISLAYYLHYFLAGFLLCDLYLTENLSAIPKLVWDLIGTAALAWIFFGAAPFYYVTLPFVIVALYLAGLNGTIYRAIFACRPISIIGGMCYSLYLTHTAVLAAMTPLVHRVMEMPLGDLRLPIILALCLSAVLAVGTLFFVLIERPCMDPNWPHQLKLFLKRQSPLPTKP